MCVVPDMMHKRNYKTMCFFECLPVVQVWAFSKIQSNPYTFFLSINFANMELLFFRVSPQMKNMDHLYESVYVDAKKQKYD